MMDYFTEHIVKRKKSGKDVILIILILIAAAILALAGLAICIAIPLVGQFAILISAGAIWGAYILITSRSVEFEYIVTNGETDFDRIAARRKRKRLISVPAKEIEVIAPITDRSADQITNIIDASSNNPTDNPPCYMVTVKDGVKTKIIFNPSQKMLKIYKKFRPQAMKVSVSDE